MNKQRKVVITTTYNEMGIIIDTKAEEVAQPEVAKDTNVLTNDCISRQAAIDALGERPMVWIGSDYELGARNQYDADVLAIETVPSAQPEIVRCKDCKHRYVEDMIWHCPFGLMGGENFFCGYGSLGTVERRRDG